MLELLTVDEMRRADALAVASGTSSLMLMENAGQAVAAVAARMAPIGSRIGVLCGSGNNGGDGFVAARWLASWGYKVDVAMVTRPQALTGDAAEMAKLWPGPIDRDCRAVIDAADLVIDAFLGAGLSRPLSGAMAEAVMHLETQRTARHLNILAVDVPSGLDGDTGQVVGDIAVQATATVTFFRRKPGHLLLPGRDRCGTVTIAEIGIDAKRALVSEDAARLEANSPPDRPIKVSAWVNAPDLWALNWPRLMSQDHKYTRGHVVVVSGPPEATGAARLGARGALRAGAGLVTVASPRNAVAANAAHLTAIMLAPFDAPDGLREVLADRRRNAVLIGPGCGVGASTAAMVRHALSSGAATVLDADALTSFAAAPPELFAAIGAYPGRRVVLTPHEGEFARLFGKMDAGLSKVGRARHAARTCGATVILKGADTTIACPDGRAAINENAPPWLGTAGSGDVLAGIVTGLLARGMPAWEAACAAVWLHGECARTFGIGLIAEDLPETLPTVLSALERHLCAGDHVLR